MWWDRIIAVLLVLAAAAWTVRLGWRTVRSWRRGSVCNNCASGGCNTESIDPAQKVVALTLDDSLRRRTADRSHRADQPDNAPAGVGRRSR